MSKILLLSGDSVTPNFTKFTTEQITPKQHEGERFWFVWWYCLSASNPFVHCGSAYQEWQANRALVRRLCREGMTESEILSFALFGLVVEVSEWS